MDQEIKLFLKESIDLELNIGDLYELFSVKFPEDYDFWWKISMEEMNHAALIESINDIFMPESINPAESIEKQTHDLREMNQLLKERIEQYKLIPPTRLEAFKFGMELENSAGESHFEAFMTEEPTSQMERIFQKLNGDDKNHAIRMARYMKANVLPTAI
jgi:hypothetical protein